ncbi:MAG: CRISPR-associated CARF protein Csa3, partial [Sulfolobales archaeon]
MASYIFTLGFHEDFILRRLLSEKAQPGNRIVVFTVKPAAGATKTAYQNLATYCIRMGLSSPELVELSIGDAEDMISSVLDILETLEEPIIADLTGGMRILVIAIYTALIASKKRFRVYVATEGEQRAQITIESTHIEAITKELTEEKRKILETIVRNPGITPPQLARIMQKSEKTIANHITELKKQ